MNSRASILLVAPLLSACNSTPSGGDVAAFRDSFNVDKATLANSGSAAYLRLLPGSTLTYSHNNDTLTITILSETATIDGVITRVVEERETADGHLAEISRNFFAFDPASGDLYYFGEEVDIYENGRIANHAGAWRSGVNGARFGLIAPGKPSVGDRYYQEVAPGVAMDRAEVVATDEQIETPAGVFEHCLHIRESTPLERGTSHKWFAPGVGLVRDDEFVLVFKAP